MPQLLRFTNTGTAICERQQNKRMIQTLHNLVNQLLYLFHVNCNISLI